MNYPLISEYIDSILCAEDNFATLTHLRPVLDHEGNPIMSSGNFAVVFKMRDERTKKEYAVKCFTKDQEGRSASYKRISDFLKGISSQYLVNFQYCEDELFVDTSVSSNDMYPIVLMDWVSGNNLTNYINSILDNKQELYSLLLEFKDFLTWMLSQPFAHGDLKPDNILINQAGKIVLVDYDGMYVPSMHGEKAREYGSPDFRNPHKEFEGFDEDMDVFSLISIYLSLSLIAYDSANLMKFASSERLLFSINDYYDFQNCDIYQYIQNSFRSDGKIRKLTETLKTLCDGKKHNTSVIGEIRRILANNATSINKEYSILPTSEVYIEAIQNYRYSLVNVKNVNLEPIIVGNQVQYIKGVNSIVFKMYDRMSRKYYALKCYTNISSKVYERLQIVSKRIQKEESKYIVKLQVINNALNTNCYSNILGEGGAVYPIVLMEWIEGKTLYNYFNSRDLSQDNFDKVIYNFKKFAAWLLQQKYSHGDLSPQNIIVTADNNIKLIDYDNMVFSNETNIPQYIYSLRDENYICPFHTNKLFNDNIDNLSLVSIMISLIYKYEDIRTSGRRYRNSFYSNCFLTQKDYKDISNSTLFKSIEKSYSFDYHLSDFLLCLKQLLRNTIFLKEELLYLFQNELPKEEHSYWSGHEGPNARTERMLMKIFAVCSIVYFLAPFLLLSFTTLNLLGVTITMLIGSIVLFVFFFICASLRPDKSVHMSVYSDDYLGFGCLSGFAAFLPILFMSDTIVDLINKNLSWINLPTYNEPWYITAAIWLISYFTLSIGCACVLNNHDLYDYETLIFDIKSHKYNRKREKFLERISEDEYNYNYSNDFNDKRLHLITGLNLLSIFVSCYVVYQFIYMGLDLIIANIIIAIGSFAGTLLVKPILKDKYGKYSHQAQKLHTCSLLTKIFLPLITIPLAFPGITNFLNAELGTSFMEYNLGLKELLINATLYLFIFYNPFLREDYL